MKLFGWEEVNVYGYGGRYKPNLFLTHTFEKTLWIFALPVYKEIEVRS